jgi:hypothetical protein
MEDEQWGGAGRGRDSLASGSSEGNISNGNVEMEEEENLPCEHMRIREKGGTRGNAFREILQRGGVPRGVSIFSHSQ